MTTGSPLAQAERSAIGKPSLKEGSTNASEAVNATVGNIFILCELLGFQPACSPSSNVFAIHVQTHKTLQQRNLNP
jgi:hypothetical protein